MLINDVHKAYILNSVSSLLIVLNQFNIKYFTVYISAPLTLGIRASLLFIFNYYFIFKSDLKMVVHEDKAFSMLIYRSMASAATVMLVFISSAYIPIGVANTLYNSNPIFIFFIESYYYKTIKLNRVHFILTFVCFLGVVLILQPQVLFGDSYIPPEQYPFYILSLIAAITSSISFILLHELTDKSNKNITLQYAYTFQAASGYFIYMLSTGGAPAQIHQNIDIAQIVITLLFISLVAFLAQYTRITAFSYTKASTAAPFAYVGIIGALLVDIFIFEANLNLLTVIGIFLTSVGLLTKLFIGES